MVRLLITFILLPVIFFWGIKQPFAGHMKGKPQPVIDTMHGRTMGKPDNAMLNKTTFNPASNNKSLLDSKAPKQKDVNSKFNELISSTNLLSVLYFDGNNLLIDQKSEQISETTKLPSQSMAKSFVSYLLGHAICKGKISSIEDPVSKYLKATSGTLYGNKTLRQMINMMAGDGDLFDRGGVGRTIGKIRQGGLRRGQAATLADYDKWDFLPNYDVLMIMGATTVYHSIDKAKGIKGKSKLEYSYSSLVADIVFTVIGEATKQNLDEFVQRNLAERAGTTDEMIWLLDKDSSPVGSSGLYATRKDYLRLGIMIANDWKSDTCIGKYLRDVEKNKISKGSGGGFYGGFFHFDRNASMKGHGGQRIIIDWDSGSVLILNAKTDDYDFKNNFESISPE